LPVKIRSPGKIFCISYSLLPNTPLHCIGLKQYTNVTSWLMWLRNLRAWLLGVNPESLMDQGCSHVQPWRMSVSNMVLSHSCW
jgi:hypothetical protein